MAVARQIYIIIIYDVRTGDLDEDYALWWLCRTAGPSPWCFHNVVSTKRYVGGWMQTWWSQKRRVRSRPRGFDLSSTCQFPRLAQPVWSSLDLSRLRPLNSPLTLELPCEKMINLVAGVELNPFSWPLPYHSMSSGPTSDPTSS